MTLAARDIPEQITISLNHGTRKYFADLFNRCAIPVEYAGDTYEHTIGRAISAFSEEPALRLMARFPVTKDQAESLLSRAGGSPELATVACYAIVLGMPYDEVYTALARKACPMEAYARRFAYNQRMENDRGGVVASYDSEKVYANHLLNQMLPNASEKPLTDKIVELASMYVKVEEQNAMMRTALIAGLEVPNSKDVNRAFKRFLDLTRKAMQRILK